MKTSTNTNAQHRAWEAKVDLAFSKVYELIPYTKSEVNFMTLEDTDMGGYWFSYRLREDNSKHRICVKHTDI